ncbi:hypothetical protein A1O3_07570 [Capronia epimyces CBS 606.96]|uniref:Uncharacterized protein n=1 Tax=Capronia epimyces CBS 606.96 TaxID=1182542 RepID=W9XVA4_9EURO|nr:uncharacterized protein A1O3_07570 [Capronia epimyces CBS 606.96]EXJ81280.1 hypothetical protein A1O3_07570 [Capronia epimyces CBS 606.96]
MASKAVKDMARTTLTDKPAILTLKGATKVARATMISLHTAATDHKRKSKEVAITLMRNIVLVVLEVPVDMVRITPLVLLYTLIPG